MKTQDRTTKSQGEAIVAQSVELRALNTRLAALERQPSRSSRAGLAPSWLGVGALGILALVLWRRRRS